MSITKDDANSIAKKLRAEVDKTRRAHDYALIWHKGELIAKFGIRRGSRRDLGHGHIKQQLFLTQKQVRDLAQCPMSREDWISEMRDKGKIRDQSGK